MCPFCEMILLSVGGYCYCITHAWRYLCVRSARQPSCECVLQSTETMTNVYITLTHIIYIYRHITYPAVTRDRKIVLKRLVKCGYMRFEMFHLWKDAIWEGGRRKDWTCELNAGSCDGEWFRGSILCVVWMYFVCARVRVLIERENVENEKYRKEEWAWHDWAADQCVSALYCV